MRNLLPTGQPSTNGSVASADESQCLLHELRETRKMIGALSECIQTLSGIVKQNTPATSPMSSQDPGRYNRDGANYNRRPRQSRYEPYGGSRGGNNRGRGGFRPNNPGQAPATTSSVAQVQPNAVVNHQDPPAAIASSAPAIPSNSVPAIDRGPVMYSVPESYVLVHRDSFVTGPPEATTVSEKDDDVVVVASGGDTSDGARTLSSGAPVDEQPLPQRTRGLKKV